MPRHMTQMSCALCAWFTPWFARNGSCTAGHWSARAAGALRGGVGPGPGIHGEDRERVFERFYRTDASRSRETGGTGLGLSIVAAIVEQHDGRIHIEETDGGGATFVISLPFYPPPVSDD